MTETITPISGTSFNVPMPRPTLEQAQIATELLMSTDQDLLATAKETLLRYLTSDQNHFRPAVPYTWVQGTQPTYSAATTSWNAQAPK